MNQTMASIRTLHHANAAIGWAGQRTLTIDSSMRDGGSGLGYTGGELLLLAVGACYCNDLFREAAKRALHLIEVIIDLSADWDAEMDYVEQITWSVTVEAAASEAEIADLIHHVDQIAEVPNTLRRGALVKLGKAQAIASHKPAEY